MRSLDVRSPGRTCSNAPKVEPALLDLSEELFEACQQNKWLRLGGPTRMKLPPRIEELPYVFLEANDIEDLIGYFCRSERHMREGVIYKDLAFVQQVDFGDEWWTLKFDDEEARGWVPFESLAMTAMALDPQPFADFVEHLHEASTLACEVLAYEALDNIGFSNADSTPAY